MALLSPTGQVISGIAYRYPTRLPYVENGTAPRIVVQPIILGLPARREDLTVKPPETVTPAAAPAPASWLDQEMIPGVKNTWLALGGGLAAMMFFGSKR